MSAVQINPATGLLKSVLYLPSPHCDDRPTDSCIDMIVVHGISLPAGQFGTDAVAEFFTGTLDVSSHPDFLSIAHLRVSAHLFIRRDGSIIQFVPFNKRAWHAGESSFQGKTRCNDFSIGIELEGTDHIPYELIQYTQLANVIRLLRTTYPDITADRIVGHVDIAPGRKTDPGPVFDWAYLRGILA
jgi:AmpD protein